MMGPIVVRQSGLSDDSFFIEPPTF
jgi:hypothetical protein